MGKRGPKPTPTAILLQRGSPHGKRRKNEVAPETLDAERVPLPPLWLNADAREHFRELAHELARAGLLTRLDAFSLGMLCDRVALYCASKQALCTEGEWDVSKLTSLTADGNAYQSVELGICNRAWDGIVKMLAQFGMTPASRVGLSVDAKSGKVVDAKSKFFKVAN